LHSLQKEKKRKKSIHRSSPRTEHCSPSAQLKVPKKEEHGEEDEKESVRAEHRSLLEIRVQPGRLDTRLQNTITMVSSSLSICPRFEKKEAPATSQ
jgi:hypothetical protein